VQRNDIESVTLTHETTKVSTPEDAALRRQSGPISPQDPKAPSVTPGGVSTSDLALPVPEVTRVFASIQRALDGSRTEYEN